MYVYLQLALTVFRKAELSSSQADKKQYENKNWIKFKKFLKLFVNCLTFSSEVT